MKFERRIQRIILDLEDLYDECSTLTDREIVDEVINRLRYSSLKGRD